MSSPRHSSLKFPKALAAAGLAAILVGCGGGSSDTASEPAPEPTPEPTPAPAPAPDPAKVAYRDIKAAYDSVNSLVQALTVDSSAGQVQNARMQVDGLLSDIRTSADLSSSDRSSFLNNARNLETRIEGIEDRQKMAMENREWHRAIKEHTVPGMRPSRTGGGRTVSGLPKGWEGKQYGNLIIGPGDQGGRIFNNNEGMTDFKTTWEMLASMQASDPNHYLGNRVEVNDSGGSGNLGANGTIGAVVEGAPVVGGDMVETRIHRSYFIQTPANGNYIHLDAPDGYPITNASTNYSANLFNRPVNFQCSQICTVSFNSDGFLVVSFDQADLTAGTRGTFRFAATELGTINGHMVTLKQDDRSYSEFGYWAKVDSSPLRTFTVDIDTFAEVTGALTTIPSALRGTATYEGLAAGFYTMNEGSARGQFTADVELTADFNDNDISGMVDDFDSVTNMNHNLNSWKLTLEDAEFDDTNFGNTPSAFSGTTMATGRSSGHWQGIFGGQANPGDSDNSNDYPEGVAGEFVGHFSNGHAAGAFGAEID